MEPITTDQIAESIFQTLQTHRNEFRHEREQVGALHNFTIYDTGSDTKLGAIFTPSGTQDAPSPRIGFRSDIHPKDPLYRRWHSLTVHVWEDARFRLGLRGKYGGVWREEFQEATPAPKSKSGQRNYSVEEKRAAYLEWQALDRDVDPITLAEWLERKFGTSPGGDLNVQPSTFYGWKRYLKNS